MDGVINVYKDKGFTSHDVVAKIRKILSLKKVGHTGTLDPDASGVLPICVGKAVKISDYIMCSDKEYVADIVLGKVTDTCDASGVVIRQSDVDFNEQRIKEVVFGFLGTQLQVPPMYSAIKVHGRKLYEFARAGVVVERQPRSITVFDLEILSFSLPCSFRLRVLCSKGTYIRSLAFDIGEKLGCGAHLANLVRTKSGCFSIDDSVGLGDLKKSFANSLMTDFLIPMDRVLTFPAVSVSSEANNYLMNGNKIAFKFIASFLPGADEKIMVYSSTGVFIGIYLVCDGFIKPVKILV